MDRKSVLIIKHGYSETCDHSISPVVSYGDVFRCSCLLEDFKDCHVSWITAKAAADLLEGNHLVDQLILADSPDQLPAGKIQKHYSVVINLEKQKDWCEFANDLDADVRYGFKKWHSNGSDAFYPDSEVALSTALDRDGYRPLQETLFKTVGREWNGERYTFGYRPNVAEIYDIGLNNHVGPKWPTKAWPKSYWQELHEALSSRYAVCWQQSLGSIRHYIEWLASCRLIVTCDSLGLHLGLGLKKKIVALFGPTPPEQVYMYGCGMKLTPLCERSCVPCFQSRCDFERNCMEYITVDMVLEAVNMLVKPSNTQKQPVQSSKAVQAEVLYV